MNKEISIHICQTNADFEIAKSIARDYIEWLGMDLSFQNIDKEFSVFEQMYGYPKGVYIYAKYKNDIAGGIGCRMLESKICEMKRLFVYQNFQGKGIGKLLCHEIIMRSKLLGYAKMRLDTVSKLESANKLYEKIGFYDIPAYYENPDQTVRYMEIKL